jgi:hypothetical protein
MSGIMPELGRDGEENSQRHNSQLTKNGQISDRKAPKRPTALWSFLVFFLELVCEL